MAIVTLNGANLTLSGQNVTLSANYVPRVVVSRGNQAFDAAGIGAENTAIVYKVADSLVSYVPGRGINGVTAFETDQGYYIVADPTLDLTAIADPN